jgi:glucans biosynthesis protein
LLHPALALLWLLLAAPAWASFGFADVDEMARSLSSRPYAPPPPVLPKTLKDLNYDQYRSIRFNPERSLWRKERLPFEVQFFHPGGFYDQPVRIDEVVNGTPREIAFDPNDFIYGTQRFERTEVPRLGFAGFRIHSNLNTPRYKDELVVFLGASYFRALARGQGYGGSARGLAIDTAEARGEEFPRFERFWLVRPAQRAGELTVYALLNSRRATGAYRFVIKPGAPTVTEVQARVYVRENNAKFGLAPLTSMYFFGENHSASNDDFRPEVHDSDGLSIHSASGEWIWRPLINPRRLLVSSFALTDPRGFGLMQRDERFASYEDLESRYERRPSMWVETIGRWGAGRVELVQIPTPDETNDNIVAYWVPQQAPTPGKPFDLAYRLYWQGATERRPPHAWVVQTRRGRDYTPLPDDVVRFVVDFEGPAFKQLPKNSAVLVDYSVTGGQRLTAHAFPNDVTGGWRAVLLARRTERDRPLELRAALRANNTLVSETWSYLLPPPQ